MGITPPPLPAGLGRFCSNCSLILNISDVVSGHSQEAGHRHGNVEQTQAEIPGNDQVVERGSNRRSSQTGTSNTIGKQIHGVLNSAFVLIVTNCNTDTTGVL